MFNNDDEDKTEDFEVEKHPNRGFGLFVLVVVSIAISLMVGDAIYQTYTDHKVAQLQGEVNGLSKTLLEKGVEIDNLQNALAPFLNPLPPPAEYKVLGYDKDGKPTQISKYHRYEFPTCSWSKNPTDGTLIVQCGGQNWATIQSNYIDGYVIIKLRPHFVN